MPERGNNGRFISTPKRDRSANNKALHREKQYQAERAKKIEKLVEKGYGPAEIGTIMSAGTSIGDLEAKLAAKRAKHG
jgi:hypothetical protein